jgi:hypothetical protein
MQKKTSTKKTKDENKLAKSVIDDIIEETESEDFGKEKEPRESEIKIRSRQIRTTPLEK